LGSGYYSALGKYSGTLPFEEEFYEPIPIVMQDEIIKSIISVKLSELYFFIKRIEELPSFQSALSDEEVFVSTYPPDELHV
jgi:hypothetical protein